MDFSVSSSDQHIAISGQIDTAGSALFEEQLSQAVEARPGHVKIDCSQLEYICSSGLRVLIALQKRLSLQDRSISVCNLPAQIREIFDMTGFSRIIPVE